MSDRNIGLSITSLDLCAANSFSGSRHYYGSSSNAAAAAASSSPSEEPTEFRITIDLVAAARRHLSFLRSVAGSPLLDNPAAILYSIRRSIHLFCRSLSLF